MQLRQSDKQSIQRYVAPKRAVRAKLPCFLCSVDLEIRTDKNGKRYFICDECGVQAFIRRKAGISRLARLVRQLKKRNSQTISSKNSALEVGAVLAEIEELKGQIKKLKGKGGIFGDPDRKRAMQALQNRVNALLSMLEKHAKTVQQIAGNKK